MTAASTEPRRINDVVVNEGEGRTDLSLCAVLNPSDLYPRNGRIIVGTLAGGDAEFGFSCSPETAVGLARELVDLANEVAKVVPIDGAHDNPHAIVGTYPSTADLDKLEALTLAASPGGVLAKFDSTDQADQIRQFTENLTHGSGEVWGVVVPINGKEIVDECAYSAITGNGPTSEANAGFYSVARENTLTLIAQVRALTARLRMCEAVSAMADSERDVDTREILLAARKWRETAHGGHRSWAIDDREDAELVSAIDAHFIKEKR